MIIPEWLFQEPIENKFKKLYNPKPLGQTARDNMKLDDKELNKQFAQNMPNSHRFTDRVSKVEFKTKLGSHHINHAYSKSNITPNCPKFVIEVRNIKKNINDLSVIYARLLNQFIFNYQTVFSARFDKQDEDNHVLHETELFITLNINHILT